MVNDRTTQFSSGGCQFWPVFDGNRQTGSRDLHQRDSYEQYSAQEKNLRAEATADRAAGPSGMTFEKSVDDVSHRGQANPGAQ
jgi:hypothetical protein